MGFPENIKLQSNSQPYAMDRAKCQMNQKIEIFSFVALPSPNAKKNYPKWDVGKDCSSQAFIQR